MLKEKELKLLVEFRRNARQPLTRMSRTTGVPVSTIFDRLKQYEGSIIKKHVALLDFRKLGYDLRVNFLFAVENSQRDDFLKYILSNKNTNSVFKVNNNFDFFVESIFKDMQDFQEFNDSLEMYDIGKQEEYFVLDELKREDFFSNPSLIPEFFKTQRKFFK